MHLRKSLNDRNTQLAARLHVIESKAKELLEYAQAGAHLTFTTHGYSHVSAVEENYDWLLSAQDIAELNPMEVFCLLCGTFFHDAMMIPQQLGDEVAARRDHATRAGEFLIKNHQSLGLTIHEGTAISQVIRGHAVNKLDEVTATMALGNVRIDLRKLAACLSMADICHADASRAPYIVFKHLELDEESAFHWRRHLQISGITRNGDRILMDAVHFSDEGARAVEAYKEQIEHQLTVVSPYFRSQLNPLSGVELQSQRLQSQLDVPMRFEANVPAILDILIEGVYQRSDVFLRELVQNSLDACHLRLAKTLKRAEPYSARIVISLLTDKGSIRGLRIDDNGIGMDIGDVQDTVLWIGNSISKRRDVTSLLNETTRKNLIATFGIGLLSCFKCASQVFVRSKKEGRDALEFRASSISDEIRPSAAPDDEVGSTFIITLRDDMIAELDLRQAITHYFRMVQQASVELMQLEVGPQIEAYTRTDIFRIGKSEAKVIPIHTPTDKLTFLTRELKADNFVAWIAVTKPEKAGVETEEGKVTILNEGVFVSQDDSSQWLPPHLTACSGMINFAAKAVDLPVSRDKVIDNNKVAQRRDELAARSVILVDDLVGRTSTGDDAVRNTAALTLALMFSRATEDAKARMVRRFGDYQVKLWNRERNTSLSEIVRQRPAIVNVEYSAGRWVSDLAEFDGKQLYHKPDDLLQLQAAVLTQDGELVISAARLDTRENNIIEFQLIHDFFALHSIAVADLTETDRITGRFRSKPLPRRIRGQFSSEVKFFEVPGLPNKRGWRLETETWINLSNPQMAKVYDMLQSEHHVTWRVALAGTLVDLCACRFEESANDILEILFSDFIQ